MKTKAPFVTWCDICDERIEQDKLVWIDYEYDKFVHIKCYQGEMEKRKDLVAVAKHQMQKDIGKADMARRRSVARQKQVDDNLKYAVGIPYLFMRWLCTPSKPKRRKRKTFLGMYWE